MPANSLPKPARTQIRETRVGGPRYGAGIHPYPRSHDPGAWRARSRVFGPHADRKSRSDPRPDRGLTHAKAKPCCGRDREPPRFQQTGLHRGGSNGSPCSRRRAPVSQQRRPYAITSRLTASHRPHRRPELQRPLRKSATQVPAPASARLAFRTRRVYTTCVTLATQA